MWEDNRDALVEVEGLTLGETISVQILETKIESLNISEVKALLLGMEKRYLIYKRVTEGMIRKEWGMDLSSGSFPLHGAEGLG